MMILSVALLAFSGLDAADVTTKLENIFLRLLLRGHAEPHRDVYHFNTSEIIPHMDFIKNTVIYFHGFTESVNSASVATIVNAYLKRGDHNVIVVDWSELSGGNYMQVVSHVEGVGAHIARAIGQIVEGGMSLSRVHLVGHSMGAHVAGTVGRKLGSPLPRITGLDPAGPFFNFLKERLTHTDAQFVDIIHTDSGFYGVARSTGNVDFWPNSGNRVQPGCPLSPRVYSDEDFCSHHRSYIYYAESVINETAFLAVKCSLETAISRSVSTVPMGYAVPIHARGSYCLTTASTQPFGLSSDGAHSPDSIAQLLPI